MRWENEATLAAEALGWTVVETDGVDDWQGWGVLLLRRWDEWATLSWSYGSCNGCDAYEDEFPYDQTDEERVETAVRLFGPLIESGLDNEEAARMKFSERKGW